MEDLESFGFEMPLEPPQIEREAQSALADLIMSAPKWDAAFSIELVTLARRHQVIRSLLGFNLELALEHQNNLETEDDEKQVYRHQGAIRALKRANSVIFEGLVAADEYVTRKIAETQEENNESPQSPQHVP